MLNRIEDYWIEEPNDTPTPVVSSNVMVVKFVVVSGGYQLDLNEPFSTYLNFINNKGMIFGINDISPEQGITVIDIYPLVYIGRNNDDTTDGTYRMIFNISNTEIILEAETLDTIPHPVGHSVEPIE